MNSTCIDSPIGPLTLVAAKGALLEVQFAEPGARASRPRQALEPVLEACAEQLAEYFGGRRKSFELPLAPQGTEFQRAVWSALAAIPFGELRSYSDIARDIGRPRAVRAVGAANGRNPLPIIVPCHRVIGSDGTLTGFAGGLEAKRRLLQLEKSWPGETF